MTKELMYVINQLYMRSKCKCLKFGYIYKGKVERTAQVVVVKNKEDMKWEE